MSPEVGNLLNEQEDGVLLSKRLCTFLAGCSSCGGGEVSCVPLASKSACLAAHDPKLETTAPDEDDDKYSALLVIKLAIPARGVDDKQSSLSDVGRDRDGDEDLDDSSNESDSSLAAAPSDVSTVAVEETILCRIGDLAVGLYITGCCGDCLDVCTCT